jgi:hypothetical protein
MVAWTGWKNNAAEPCSVFILSLNEQLIVFRGLTLLLRILKNCRINVHIVPKRTMLKTEYPPRSGILKQST